MYVWREVVGLSVRAISFQDFQPDPPTSQTDRLTDDMQSQCKNSSVATRTFVPLKWTAVVVDALFRLKGKLFVTPGILQVRVSA